MSLLLAVTCFLDSIEHNTFPHMLSCLYDPNRFAVFTIFVPFFLFVLARPSSMMLNSSVKSGHPGLVLKAQLKFKSNNQNVGGAVAQLELDAFLMGV